MVASGRISNSFKLLYMSSLPANMKRIQSKCNNIVFPIISLWIFFKRSRAAYYTVLVPIWPNLEHVRDVMDVLVTCKYEEDPIKNEGARVLTTFPHYNPMGAIRCHGHQSSGPIWPKTYCSLSPTPMMAQIKFRYAWSTGCGDIQV